MIYNDIVLILLSSSADIIVSIVEDKNILRFVRIFERKIYFSLLLQVDPEYPQCSPDYKNYLMNPNLFKEVRG